MSCIAMTLYPKQTTMYGDTVGEIQIGDFKETFGVSMRYWSYVQYLEHWKEALGNLFSGDSKGALISSMDNPTVGGGFAVLWVFYRVGADVVFQNRMLILDDCRPPFDPAEVDRWIPERTTHDEDGMRVSEWRVSFSDLEFSVGLSQEE